MAREPTLSYKFQRLRERLRSAVANGELTGKLPGERSLARRFHVNAKTLSKALTDLAAEGLLHRSIGRGTYVRPAGGAAAPDLEATPGRWLILCDPGREDSSLVRLLQQSNPESLVTGDAPGCARPSFLKSFAAVIDLAAATPEHFLRDLIVRNIPLVSVNREPDVHSLNFVAADLAQGAHALARDLILGGHQRLAVVETVPRSPVGRAVALAAQRYGSPEATSTATSKDQVMSEVESGATAVICDAVTAAHDLRAALDSAGLRIPDDLSLAAVGCCEEGYPCSGHYVEPHVIAQAIEQALASAAGPRPIRLWLAPHWMDLGTTRALSNRAEDEAA
jgi:hypothetical protein